jgi:hypothetical protein
MLFREGALRASCGCALQIFPDGMTDNILVIDGRKRLGAVSSPDCRRSGKFSRKGPSRKKCRLKSVAARVVSAPRCRQ